MRNREYEIEILTDVCKYTGYNVMVNSDEAILAVSEDGKFTEHYANISDALFVWVSTMIEQHERSKLEDDEPMWEEEIEYILTNILHV